MTEQLLKELPREVFADILQYAGRDAVHEFMRLPQLAKHFRIDYYFCQIHGERFQEVEQDEPPTMMDVPPP
jgi:hypothetical protein